LLSYINNLTYIILKKCKFQSIKNDPTIERLVEQRTVLERIRPLEFKMKYQIDKLVKTALSGSVDPNDPDRFRATIDGLADAEEDHIEDEESDNDEAGHHKSKKVKDGVYVAPKVTAVPYDGDESRAVKKQKLLERAKKRALQSSVMQELREEYADTPVEVQINTVGLKNKQSKYDYERQKYEEDYFTRYKLIFSLKK
jgi:U3 small nucleolar ribonucleoprotein protein LCP5